MSDPTDKRLSFKPYRQVLESVQTQFDLIRFSLKIIKQKDRKQFFKQKAETRLDKIKKFWLIAKQEKIFSDRDIEHMEADQIEYIKSQHRRENRVGNLHANSEFSEDRLNQSELLLLVAHFESFMKLIHERFLLAGPHKVFGKGFRDEQNPKIPVKDIFDSTQNYWNTHKFLGELVAK